jgi:hypothetical protein
MKKSELKILIKECILENKQKQCHEDALKIKAFADQLSKKLENAHRR